jgi:hypothetical protein
MVEHQGRNSPVRWELQVREKKTKKLLKKLPEDERPVRPDEPD